MASVTSDVSTSTLTLNCGPRAGVPDLWIHSHRREETENKHVLLVLLLASPVYYVCLSFSKVKILLWFFKPRWLGGFWLIDINWLIGTLLSRCTQQGETRNTQTRINFKIIVFNDDIKGRQGKVDTPGITSRPDEMEYKRQDLNTHSQITHTWTRII